MPHTLKRKLQRTESVWGMNPSQLMNIIFRVFNSGEQLKKKDAKCKASLLAAALDSKGTDPSKKYKVS